MTASSGLPNPCVQEMSDVPYDEVERCLKICTEHGLRARAYYNRGTHPDYVIYADGDKAYALAAFVTYTYNKTGDLPRVKTIGSPAKDLTYRPA